MEIARGGEVLEALTRILRREATESALVTLREREPVECADGKVRELRKSDGEDNDAEGYKAFDRDFCAE